MIRYIFYFTVLFFTTIYPCLSMEDVETPSSRDIYFHFKNAVPKEELADYACPKQGCDCVKLSITLSWQPGNSHFETLHQPRAERKWRRLWYPQDTLVVTIRGESRVSQSTEILVKETYNFESCPKNGSMYVELQSSFLGKFELVEVNKF